MGNVNKFDKMLNSASQAADHLDPWKVAYLQQVEKQGHRPPTTLQEAPPEELSQESSKPKKSK